MPFPVCADGDVLIIIPPSGRLQLHASTLRESSPVLAKLLKQEYAAILSTNALNAGVNVRFRLELRHHTNRRDDIGYWVRVPLDHAARPVGDDIVTTAHGVNDNGKIPNPVHQCYMSILGAFYNITVPIDDANVSTILKTSLLLLDVAQALDCVRFVSPAIDMTLVKQAQTLWRSVSFNPVAWAKVAYRIQSDIIFKEAVIHLVGQWNQCTHAQKQECGKTIREYVEAKHAELHQRKVLLEAILMGIYLKYLERDIETGRSGYANDILVWISMAFFRHWIGQQVAYERGARAPDGGHAFYRLLGQAGDAYMDRDDLNDFQHRFPMTRKGQAVVENHVKELKELAKERVLRSGILANASSLDISAHPVAYLLSARVDKAEFVWNLQPSLKRTRSESYDVDAFEDEDDEEEDDDDEDVGSDDGPYKVPRLG